MLAPFLFELECFATPSFQCLIPHLPVETQSAQNIYSKSYHSDQYDTGCTQLAIELQCIHSSSTKWEIELILNLLEGIDSRYMPMPRF